ncbi:MAG: DUF493 domain-containing protein [Planctomycetaceae bacterium]
MFSLPALELLQSTHQFPGLYTFKAIGHAEDHFPGRVLAAVRSQLPSGSEPAFSTRTTSSGRHTAVTVEPAVESAEQVLDIYRALQEVEGLEMLL